MAGPDKNADPEVGLMQLFADPDRNLYAKSFVPSTGVHTRLHSRAVVIERDGVPHALAQVDLGGIPYAMTQAVLDRIADLGIREDQLLLSATHTHSGTGPIWGVDHMGYGVLGGERSTTPAATRAAPRCSAAGRARATRTTPSGSRSRSSRARRARRA